jgi:lipoprotein-anchoring transpeptidase ErfK/SrfK
MRIVARDAAGNTTVRWRKIVVDTKAPQVRTASTSPVLKTRNPTIRGVVHDRSPVHIRAVFDGDSAKVVAKPGGRGAWKLPLKDLPQGLHVLLLDVTDPAGNSTTITKQFTVDSTDELNDDLVLQLGARGNDVKQLQRRLRKEGHFKGPLSNFYNARTVAAVERFQAANQMAVDGVAGPAVIAATSGRLLVHLNQFRVFVIKEGKVVFSAPIAIGQPSYPTPTGRYAITSMIKNPTWVPPNSPWAAGLEPIPPGASNPLGSRWIGTSAPNIGFHATNAPSSVGHAASHGCMRMYQADVERMYELVKVGMPVDIRP